MKSDTTGVTACQDSHRTAWFTWAAVGLILIAAVVRIVLASAGWPVGDSDEATVGLMARHIAFLGARPVFYWGQSYMGPLEAYVAAPLFLLLGPTIFALRLGLIIFYLGFLVCGYLLTTLLYGRPTALIALALLSLGAPEMLARQLQAIGGYLETLFFGAAILLLSTLLVLTKELSRGRRAWLLGAWGLAAGLGLWSSLLFFPFVAAGGLLLWQDRGRILRSRAALSAPLILLIIAIPVIGMNLTTSSERGSWAALVSALERMGPTAPGSAGERLAGTLLISLPLATGGNALCPLSRDDVWPLDSNASGRAIACSGVHLGWGLAFLVLWAIAVTGAVRALTRRSREERALHLARLALLAPVAFTLALYLLSRAPARDAWSYSRYLIGLLVSFPAVIAPLTARLSRFPLASRRAILPALSLLLLGAIFVSGTVQAFASRAETERINHDEATLIAALLARDATHIYSEYWTCNRLIFRSGERIICANLDDDLQPALDRYLPYREAVATSPAPLYVFPEDSAQTVLLATLPPFIQEESVAGYSIFRRSSSGMR